MLYHYTTFETFLRILEGITFECGVPYIHMRATRIDKLNDPTEMCVDIERYLKIIANYEKEHNLDNSVSNYIQTSKNQIVDILNEEKMISLPFVTSFSTRKDYLPMWSLYGDKHHGICLCFCDDLSEKIDSPIIHIPGYVSYLNHKRPSIMATILDLYYNIMDVKNKLDNSNAVEMLIGMSPFIKNKVYAYEKEFRICVYNFAKGQVGILGDELCMYDDTNDYINLTIPVSSLKCIILGKKVPFEISRLLFETYFKAHDYQIDIKQSQIPYQ